MTGKDGSGTPDLRGLFAVLTTRPIAEPADEEAADAGARSPQGPEAPRVPAGDAALLEWLRRAEVEVPRVRELIAGSRTRPDLRRRGVQLAGELIRELGAAIGEAGAPHRVAKAVAGLSNPRVVELGAMLYRASMERL